MSAHRPAAFGPNVSEPGEAAAATAAAEAASAVRALVAYAIVGDQRFLSHHDELRTMARWVRRANWPLLFSSGFNPAPRISLPLPRPVGTASNAQLAVIDLLEAADLAALGTRLNAARPPGFEVLRLTVPRSRITPHAAEALCRVELKEADAAAVAGRIAGLLASSALVIERRPAPGKPARTLDLRPFIRHVELKDQQLYLRLGFDQQASAKPLEVLQLLELPADDYVHRVNRMEVTWDRDWTGEPAWFPPT